MPKKPTELQLGATDPALLFSTIITSLKNPAAKKAIESGGPLIKIVTRRLQILVRIVEFLFRASSDALFERCCTNCDLLCGNVEQ